MDRAPTAPEQQLDRALGQPQGLPPGSSQAPTMAGKALPMCCSLSSSSLPGSHLLCRWLAAWLQGASGTPAMHLLLVRLSGSSSRRMCPEHWTMMCLQQQQRQPDLMYLHCEATASAAAGDVHCIYDAAAAPPPAFRTACNCHVKRQIVTACPAMVSGQERPTM